MLVPKHNTWSSDTQNSAKAGQASQPAFNPKTGWGYKGYRNKLAGLAELVSYGFTKSPSLSNYGERPQLTKTSEHPTSNFSLHTHVHIYAQGPVHTNVNMHVHMHLPTYINIYIMKWKKIQLTFCRGRTTLIVQKCKTWEQSLRSNDR